MLIAHSNTIFIFLIPSKRMLLFTCLERGDATNRKIRNSRVVSIAILLLMLRPHLLAPHLMLVVHRSRALRSVAAVLLVVQLRRVVGGSRVLIGVVVLLLPVHTTVR